MTSPPYWIAHPLYLNLGFELQAFPICHVRQHKLCLANFSWQRIAGIQAAACEYIPIRALDGHSQNARDTRDAVICKAYDQSLITPILVAPNERRSHTIA